MALEAGLFPEAVNGNGNGWPLRYEIRQCIEVWPAPGATEGARPASPGSGARRTEC